MGIAGSSSIRMSGELGMNAGFCQWWGVGGKGGTSKKLCGKCLTLLSTPDLQFQLLKKEGTAVACIKESQGRS